MGSNPTLSAKVCHLDSIVYKQLESSRCNAVVAAAFARVENRRGDRENTPIFYREFVLLLREL